MGLPPKNKDGETSQVSRTLREQESSRLLKILFCGDVRPRLQLKQRTVGIPFWARKSDPPVLISFKCGERGHIKRCCPTRMLDFGQRDVTMGQ